QNPSAQMHVSGPNLPSSQMPNTSVAESKPNQIQVRVEAPIVYRTRSEAPAAPKLDSPQLPLAYAGVRAPTLTTALPPSPHQANEAKAETARRGVMGKVKGFFSSIFR